MFHRDEGPSLWSNTLCSEVLVGRGEGIGNSAHLVPNQKPVGNLLCRSGWLCVVLARVRRFSLAHGPKLTQVSKSKAL